VRAQDVPAAVERAFHAAAVARGPALVIVPMNDWEAPADDEREPASAIGEIARAVAVAPEVADALAAFLDGATSPALVVGAGADDAQSRAAVVALAERLGAPVYQEAFGARAGFPHDHPLFAGLLPAGRPALRERLAPYDTLLVIGGPAFRQSFYAPGRLTMPGTRIAIVTEDPEEAYRSPAELAVLASPAAVCAALVSRVARRESPSPEPFRPPAVPAPPATGEPLRASHVLAALAERLPAEAIVLEEAPVDRPELQERLTAAQPFGYLSAAMGGLGFAVPGATGLRMALPNRPVVAVVGDGSTIYGIQGLWSAAHYRVGVLFVVLSNGGYAIMDRLAENHGGAPPWPSFGEVELATVARGFGCPARRITTYDELTASLDELVPTLATRGEPMLLDVAIAPTEAFGP
jgi:benzoylformate decarboxylase